MGVTRYMAVARRWWWLLLLTTMIGGVSAYVISRIVTPTYEATTTLLVVHQQETGSVGLADLQASERLANTFSELVTVRPVLESAIARAGLSMTPQELEDRLTVNNPPTTQLLEITAEASSASAARDLANVVADAFIDSNQSALGSRPGIVSMVESAEAPAEPSEPSPVRNALVGAFLALLATAGIIALVEYLDDTVKSDDTVGALTGVPVVGHVWQFKKPARASEQLRTALDPRSREAEAYRSIRTNLTYTLGNLEGAKRLMVTSPGPSDGKSTTAANLAVVFALAGARVVVVDADLRRPSQHRIFGIPNTNGLANILAGGAVGLDQAVQRTAHERVWLLASGPIPANPSELLGSGRMEQLLATLEDHFEIIIVDTPPALAVTDAAVVSSNVSATIVVVKHGKTRSAELKHTVQRLAVAGRPIGGVVLNGVHDSSHSYYDAYYGDPATKPSTGASRRRPSARAPMRPAPAAAGPGQSPQYPARRPPDATAGPPPTVARDIDEDPERPG